MKLPNVDYAFVTEDKITDYLLSEAHPDGRDKAAFFTRFGFIVENWTEFAEALKDHAKTHDVIRETASRHGTK